MHMPVSYRRAILNRRKCQEKPPRKSRQRSDLMRALVYQDTRLVLDRNYPIPSLVEGEALIRVTHAGICTTDLEIVRGYMAFQGVLGHEFVGVVEAAQEGPRATPLTSLIGKRVVGEINISYLPT